MGDDGGEAVLRHQGHQRRRVGGVQVLSLAPPGIAGKKLKRIRPQLQRLPSHGGKALGGGQVTADMQHSCLLVRFFPVYHAVIDKPSDLTII